MYKYKLIIQTYKNNFQIFFYSDNPYIEDAVMENEKLANIINRGHFRWWDVMEVEE